MIICLYILTKCVEQLAKLLNVIDVKGTELKTAVMSHTKNRTMPKASRKALSLKWPGSSLTCFNSHPSNK